MPYYSYGYRKTFGQQLLEAMPLIMMLVICLVLMISMFVALVTYDSQPLAERVVVVQGASCGVDTVIDENNTSATCLVHVEVASQYEVDAINGGDFQHVKFLIDGEQYAPEPEPVEGEQ